MTVPLQSAEDQRWQSEVIAQRGRPGGPPSDPDPSVGQAQQFRQCINFPKCRSLVLYGADYCGFCQGCVTVACNLRDHGPASLPAYADQGFIFPPGILPEAQLAAAGSPLLPDVDPGVLAERMESWDEHLRRGSLPDVAGMADLRQLRPVMSEHGSPQEALPAGFGLAAPELAQVPSFLFNAEAKEFSPAQAQQVEVSPSARDWKAIPIVQDD